MRKYDIYLFDFDNTLFDSLSSLKKCYEYALSFMLKKKVKLNSKETYVYCGENLVLTAKRYNFSKDETSLFVSKFLEKYNVFYYPRPFKETLKTLKSLKENGAKIGIVSNNNLEYLNDTLIKNNIDPNIFDVILGNGATKRSKPSPSAINLAIRKIKGDKKKDKIVYVGDSINDVKSGLNAKIDTCLVVRKITKLEKDVYPLYVINNLKELTEN